MFWYGHTMGGWGYACTGIGMVLFAVLLIAGIAALITFITGDQRNRPSTPTALTAEQLLAQRFAHA